MSDNIAEGDQLVSPDASDHETKDKKGRKDKKSTEVPYWNVFKIAEDYKFDDSEETLLYVAPVKIMKLLCYAVTFVVVLGFSVFSKLTLTMMSAQTVNNRTMDLCVEGTNKRYQINSSPFERMGWNWALWFTIVSPEMYTLLVSIWTLVFKKHKKPSGMAFLMILFSETCLIVGVCLLLFVVFPTLDSLQAVMFMNSLCVIPGLLILLSRNSTVEGLPIKLVIDICCLVALGGGFFLWAQASKSWLLPLAGILVSIGWWENFADSQSPNPIIKVLSDIHEELKQDNRRYFIYLIVSSWKIAASFFFLLIHLSITSEISTLSLIGNFTEAFNSTPINLSETWVTTNEALKVDQNLGISSNGMLPVYMLLIQIGASFFCFMFSVFACKICIQEFSFSFALSVSIPVTVLILSSACSWRSEDVCFLTNVFPEYVYWSCPQSDFAPSFLFERHGWIWFIWFLSQAWISSHIWAPAVIHRASTELLFINPSYNGAVIDQSLILNRRRHIRKKKKKKKGENEEKDPKLVDEEAQMQPKSVSPDYYETMEIGSNYPKQKYEDDVTNIDEYNERKRLDRTIYACATMWHETTEEMIEMIKSTMRLDLDLDAKRNSEKVTDINSVYALQVHIFFDDAFAIEKDENEVKRKVVNKFVKDLINTMPKAVAKIYPKEIWKKDFRPKIFVTPYGGRLEYALPGETPFVVHLKDKDKIRHKKRWSQVMYMYYLLGYISNKPNDNVEDWEDNTFILALDGDIDFKPGAVTKLLDLMTDTSLGAACGRIHPVGEGPIVWYQKFEYAIGHWLQKATEHVIGCVLCSPGCFSLFRAKALMEVMKKYSSEANNAIEYIQYDQGEDRWLCTLILKRGYRIEYSAASDAYTNAPDQFGDFYVQRRRWGPSTLANVMDLLLDYKATVQINNSISTPYIIYQSMIMAGTILGPGTIFLMVVGAIVSAFSISNWIALVSNFVPVCLFVLVCFFTEERWQKLFAMLLSTAYALLMMAVLVGTLLQLQEDGVASPSGIFLVAITASFIISALVHPMEFSCLAHGFLYFLLVPSMYLLLTIYSFINLFNVSWGTREDPAQKEQEELEKKEEELNKKKNNPLAQVNELLGLKDDQSFLSKICQCFLCTYQKEDRTLETEMIVRKNNEYLENICSRIAEIENKTDLLCENFITSPGVVTRRGFDMSTILESSTNEEEASTSGMVRTDSTKSRKGAEPEKQEDKENEDHPFWVVGDSLKDCPRGFLPTEEKLFWKEMIKEYLYVQLKTKKVKAKEKKAEEDLKELRNKVVFAFFMINSLFILIVFLLQMNKDKLFLNWPVNAKANVTYIPDGNRIQIDYEYLQLEPIGLVFAVFFGIILLFQFGAMLVHRLSTFTHIMADTDLSCTIQRTVEYNEQYDYPKEEGAEETDVVGEQPSTSTEKKIVPQSSFKKALPTNVGDRRVSRYFQAQELMPKVKFNSLEEMRMHTQSVKYQQGKRNSIASPMARSWQRQNSMNRSFKQRTHSGSKVPISPLAGPPPNGTVPNSPKGGHSNQAFEED